MKNYALLIKKMPVEDHAIETKYTTWEKYKTQLPQAWIIIESLFSEQPILKLNRNELKKIGSSRDYKKLIIATILWGYSAGMRGNHFAKIAENLESIAELLAEAENGIEDWPSHYDKVRSIKGLGLSTYSKFIYFMGAQVEGFGALILDMRVINAINTGHY